MVTVSITVADLGEGTGGPGTPLILAKKRLKYILW